MKYELFTDGGCRGNGTTNHPIAGVGCYLIGDNIEPIYFKETLRLRHNTNNKAEIIAVIRGLELVEENIQNSNSFVKDELTIYTDSAYAMNGITNWINNWKRNNWLTSKKEPVKNQTLWITLDNLLERTKEKFEIRFEKVKGHSGIKGNEIVDRLANEAMDKFLRRVK